MKFYTRDRVLDRVSSIGHKVFSEDSKNNNLNIIGIRSRTAKLDEFGCQLMVAWKYNGRWTDYSFPITTYPGKRYLVEKLLNPKGCAILAPGQYLDTYAIGLHRGKYEALCQKLGPVNVYRDRDRDEQFDLDPDTIMSGNFGIAIHKSSDSQTTLRVGAHSAGCQVFANGEDFDDFMTFCRRSRAVFGNSFTYTLIDAF
jgi:hypothetical protein